MRKNILADVRTNRFDYEGTTELKIKMSHDQARLLRGLLSQGTQASSGEAEALFRGIKNTMTHVVDWPQTVKANGAKVEVRKVVPTKAGTVFQARVERGWDTYEGDVFVTVDGLGRTRYVTRTVVGGTNDHSKSRITKVL